MKSPMQLKQEALEKSPCREHSNSGPSGYARVSHLGKRWLAHRLEWSLAHGPIPEGKQVLHHCDNRKCVALPHLFLGVNADNVRDKVQRLRHHRANTTTCSRGHSLKTYAPGKGRRKCKACDKAKYRKYYETHKEERRKEWRAYYKKNKDVLNAKRVERRRRTGK